MSRDHSSLYSYGGMTDLKKNYFTVPNSVFGIDLPAGALAVYFYLLRCEDRKTHECWPSFRTIGKATKQSRNTVKKYVDVLVEKQVILVENTEIVTKKGVRRNGNLRYTIMPFQDAIDHYNQLQLWRATREAEKAKVKKRAAKLGVTIVPSDESA